jgi:hypothetical protein
MLRHLFLLLALSALASCSARQVSTWPQDHLSKFSKSIQVTVESSTVDPIILDSLERNIKAKLLTAGFNLADDDSIAIRLKVSVSTFTPGNTVMRHLFGFGAGRGSLIYTAQYVDRSGAILAKMDSQERFTGTEFGFNTEYGSFATAGGEATATNVLIKEAAKHIVYLAENKLEKPAATSQ